MGIILSAPCSTEISTDFRLAAANGSTEAPTANGIPGHIEITPAPDGMPSMRMRITAADAASYGGMRSELLADFETTGIRWYAFDIYIPSGQPITPKLSFCQIHDFPDNGESPVKFPNFEFVLNGNAIEVYVPENCPSELTSNSRLIGAAPAVFDKWVRAGIHANWQTGAGGWIEAFYAGMPMAKEWWRASRYADAVGPYMQIGVYDLFHAGFSGERVIYYKNIEIGDAAENYSSMLGAPPRPAPASIIF